MSSALRRRPDHQIRRLNLQKMIKLEVPKKKEAKPKAAKAEGGAKGKGKGKKAAGAATSASEAPGATTAAEVRRFVSKEMPRRARLCKLRLRTEPRFSDGHGRVINERTLTSSRRPQETEGEGSKPAKKGKGKKGKKVDVGAATDGEGASTSKAIRGSDTGFQSAPEGPMPGAKRGSDTLRRATDTGPAVKAASEVPNGPALRLRLSCSLLRDAKTISAHRILAAVLPAAHCGDPVMPMFV